MTFQELIEKIGNIIYFAPVDSIPNHLDALDIPDTDKTRAIHAIQNEQSDYIRDSGKELVDIQNEIKNTRSRVKIVNLYLDRGKQRA